MASRGNASKVDPGMAFRAVEMASSRQAVYSQCVMISFRTTGNLAPGFDIHMADSFDAKGKKVSPIMSS